MNQFFDVNRWMLLTGKHWNENKKRYLLSLVAVASLLLLWFSFMMMMERHRPMHEDMQAITYFVGLFLVGGIFGSMLFADLATGPKGIHYLSVPASVFEKLLCALLYGVILFYVSYTVIFYLIDIPMVKLANSLSHAYWLETNEADMFKPEEITNVFFIKDQHNPNAPNFYYYLLLIFVAVQAAYILGSVYFPGYSFIKTTIALLFVFLFFVFLEVQILYPLLPRGDFMSLSRYRLYDDGKFERVIRLPEWIGSTLFFLLKYALAPVFWVVTYFRLKEKEI